MLIQKLQFAKVLLLACNRDIQVHILTIGFIAMTFPKEFLGQKSQGQL
jgi:hypothetical protein